MDPNALVGIIEEPEILQLRPNPHDFPRACEKYRRAPYDDDDSVHGIGKQLKADLAYRFIRQMQTFAKELSENSNASGKCAN